MMTLHRLWATTVARSLEFVRDRSSLGWNLLFPVLMVAGFAAIFSGPPPPLFKVAVLGSQSFDAGLHPFFAQPHVQFYAETGPAAAIAKVARHRVDLLLDVAASPPRYWINPESQKGQIVETLLLAAGGPAPLRQPVSGERIRYVDWVLPGILGMNLMISCLWGLGYVIVRYRKSGYLKRLKATPLSALEFVGSQVLSRMVLVMVTAMAMFAACRALFGIRMEGSYLDLFLLTFLAAGAMTSMGLLVAARTSSEELSGGLLNVLSTPMIIVSGVFFSLDGAPGWVQWVAGLFPLTHLLSGARAIMLDGAPLASLGLPLLVLGGMSVVFLAIGSALFKWTPD